MVLVRPLDHDVPIGIWAWMKIHAVTRFIAGRSLVICHVSKGRVSYMYSQSSSTIVSSAMDFLFGSDLFFFFIGAM